MFSIITATVYGGCIFMIIFGCAEVESRSGYILTFPHQLQVGADERFCLNLFNITDDIGIQINVSCYGQQVTHTPDTFRKGDSRCFTWQIPASLTAGTCTIDVQGADTQGSYVFSETKKVEVTNNHQITFVQTDKPIYKPGDKVRFRILTVDQDLVPVKSNVESVHIVDPSGIYMKQWLDMSVQAGLLSLNYQLYKEPVLGEWNIVVGINGKTTKQPFTILEYELPKFQVDAKIPDGLTVATKTLEFEVCAKYTFGKPVEGRLNATVCLHNKETSWYCEALNRPCAHIHATMSGCHSFAVQTDDLEITARKYSLLCKPRIRLNATVTEAHTGMSVEETVDGAGVWEERVKVKVISDKHFKPFLHYSGRVYAWKPDGSPSVGEEIGVTIAKLGISTNVTTDHTGHAQFTITNLTRGIQHFVIEAKTLDDDKTDRKVYTIYPAKARRYVRQWYSSSLTYVQLSTDVGPEVRTCGEHVELNAVLTRPPHAKIHSFTYQTVSKGNIVGHEDLTSTLHLLRPYTPKTQGISLPAKPSAELTPGIDDDNSYGDTINIPPPSDPILGNSDSRPLPVGPPGSRGSNLGPPGSRNDILEAPQKKNNDMVDTDKDREFDVDVPVASESVERPQLLEILKFNLTLTPNMFPRVRILVTMVMEDGEVIADTVDIGLQNCQGKQVGMSFSKPSVRPGSNVDLTLSAPPQSLCGITMVDKAVYLADKQAAALTRSEAAVNVLNEAVVHARLEEYDVTSDFMNDWQYCSDMSSLPPILAEPGPPSMPGYSAPFPDLHEKLHESTYGRKKRSIMQFHSNMYDSLLAYRRAGVNVFTDLDLLTRPCLHTGDILAPRNQPGDPLGFIPAEGNHGMTDYLEPAEEPVDKNLPVSNLRKHFPETWLWDLYEIPSEGSLIVKEALPDTVTEWVGNSVCLHETNGLALSQTARITTFQPFFMAVNMPYSVVRGEVANIDVTVFNYLSHCIAIQLAMIKSSDFTEVGSLQESQLCLCAEESASYTFKLRPSVLGTINITFSGLLREHRVDCRSVTAPPGLKNRQATELVVKQLIVKPEGMHEERTASKFICPHDGPDNYTFSSQSPTVSFADRVVPGSERTWVSVIGDIMGPVLNDLGSLIQLPIGCGEQNMVRMAPDISVLQYLTATGQLTDSIQVKTLDHLNKGLQQQMQFLHPDGSYSAFGTADETGSTWLSAFVFKTLRQALHYVYVDRKHIQTKTWEYLISQQEEDGCFTENGKVMSKYMMGGLAGNSKYQRKALTAYVLVAMLESFRMMRERTPPFVALAVRCVQIDNVDDTYTHSLMAYAMALYKPDSPYTKTIIDNLKAKATNSDGMMYWKRETAPAILDGQGRAASAEIEMTSYALLAMLTQNKNVAIGQVTPIVRWLTAQRNAYGGFASTQDTVVALQALSLFAKRVYGQGLDVEVNVQPDKQPGRRFHVAPVNAMVLQQFEMSEPGSDVTITTKGQGCVLVQYTTSYNVNSRLSGVEKFDLSVQSPVTTTTLEDKCKHRSLRVCSRYNVPEEASNMAVVVVKLPSGWIPDTRSLKHLMNLVEVGLKKFEIDERYSDTINLYFDEMSNVNLCFDFTIVQEIIVDEPLPSVAKVFDYYETGEEQTIFYELSACTPDNVETVDISIDNLQDLGVDEPIVSNEFHHVRNAVPAARSPDAGVAAPMAPEETNVQESSNIDLQQDGCPQCYVTGTHDLLADICSKQVWLLTPVTVKNVTKINVQVLSTTGTSPPLQISVPSSLDTCQKCQPFLHAPGIKSMSFLRPHSWTDLGENLLRTDTVLVPWSESLQAGIQQVLVTCSSS